MMVLNFQLPSYLTPFWRPKESGSTTEQEAYGVYYAVTKWNNYLQGADIIVRMITSLSQVLNRNNVNNKVNRLGT